MSVNGVPRARASSNYQTGRRCPIPPGRRPTTIGALRLYPLSLFVHHPA
ncbi:MAG: hypothetical protein MZV70_19750 [Desulfobacterales bacterium]|nr:hypothetical protein [Desulfobacterales bacterium]